jgi:nitroreductase
MESAIKTIEKRVSVRGYIDRKVEEEKRKQLMEYLEFHKKGPFGNTVRFQLVDVSENNAGELKQFGTYGMIRNAKLYLAGAVKKENGAMEDFGYCMEGAILKATELGLGSCWLGGTLNRSAFASKIRLQENEVIPAVTPLGYPGDKNTLLVNVMRTISPRPARSRRDFVELFFEDNIKNPLEKEESGKYEAVLESVRIAPSATNKQPWRIIKEKGRDSFHFYMNEDKLYNNFFKDIKLQNMDLGIAMCHFEFASQELELAGAWSFDKPDLDAGNLVYIASWIGQK